MCTCTLTEVCQECEENRKKFESHNTRNCWDMLAEAIVETNEIVKKKTIEAKKVKSCNSTL